MGKVSCNIEACTNTSILCTTKSAYSVYDIDNTGFDPSNL